MSDDEEKDDETTEASKESSSTKSESKEERKSGRDKERTDRGKCVEITSSCLECDIIRIFSRLNASLLLL